MKLLILGASGRTGVLVAQEALTRSHEVKAIVRNKEKISIPGIECYEGVPSDVTLIKKAMKEVDAVVCCLNVARQSDFPWAKIVSPETLISDTIKTLISVMGEMNVKRIVTMSAWGVGDSLHQMNWMFKFLIQHSNIRFAYNDHNRQEDLLKKSSLNWTIVRPVFLNNKDTASYQIASGKPKTTGISRKAVAKFIVDIIEKNSFIREAPVINQ